MTEPALPASAPGAPALLVIGYGNTLLGDDAVGPAIAGAVAAWGTPGVRALARTELVPELAAALAEAGRAVFVDAALAGPEVALTPLAPAAPATGGVGHALTPAGLLALTAAVYGRCPAAWLLTVPGADFTLGRPLSPRARIGARTALDLLRALV